MVYKEEGSRKIGRTYQEVLLWASSFLKKAGKEPFAAEWLMRELFLFSKTDLIQHLRSPMPEEHIKVYKESIEKHATGIPVQQIVGHEWFYGRKFLVSKDTLIPRPETEELVELVLKESSANSQKVLDIGTGTGAIACTLKAERPQDEVSALDISDAALEIAKKNGEKLRTSIQWYQGDLTQPVQAHTYDVIVSNPPYIGEEEEGTLEKDVRLYEPALALFAGVDGLTIYRRLAKELPQIMIPSTRVYLEIGFQQGEAVKNIFSKAFPKRTIHVFQDMSGKDRIIKIDGEST